ncbi:MAG TPA: hypothetical protein VF715_16720 [Thermoleophilaceae bacterium]
MYLTSPARVLPAALVALAVAAFAAADARAFALAGNERGDAAIVFQLGDDTMRPVEVLTRRAGGSFGDRTVVARGPAQDAAVDVGENGDAVVVWRETEPPYHSTSRVLASFRPSGGRFGPPEELSSDGFGFRGPPRVAVDGRGGAVVAYPEARDPVGEKFELVVAERRPGDRFGKGVSFGRSSHTVHLAVDAAGHAFVGWLLPFDQPDPGSFVRYRPPDGEWGAPQRVSEIGRAVVSELAMSPGGWGLVRLGGGETLATADRRPGESVFGPPAAHPVESVELQFDSDVADDASAIHVATEGPSLMAMLRQGEGAFGPMTEVFGGDDVGGDVFERVMLDMNGPGDGAVVWRGNRGRVGASVRPRGGSFAGPLSLAGRQRIAVRPRAPWVTLDGAGHGTAAWAESDGERIRIVARDFGAAAAGPARTVATGPAYVRRRPRSACFANRTVRTVASSSRARVFYRRKSGYVALYGCLFARGQLVPLSFGGEEDVVFPRPAVHLAGGLVGYARWVCDPEECATVVRVEDLRDDLNGVSRAFSPGSHELETPQVGSLRLKPNGAVAWISCPSDAQGANVSTCPRRSKKRVFAADAASDEPRLLAVGRTIDVRSLGLRGSRLTWRDGGKLRSATLR